MEGTLRPGSHLLSSPWGRATAPIQTMWSMRTAQVWLAGQCMCSTAYWALAGGAWQCECLSPTSTTLAVHHRDPGGFLSQLVIGNVLRTMTLLLLPISLLPRCWRFFFRKGSSVLMSHLAGNEPALFRAKDQPQNHTSEMCSSFSFFVLSEYIWHSSAAPVISRLFSQSCCNVRVPVTGLDIGIAAWTHWPSHVCPARWRVTTCSPSVMTSEESVHWIKSELFPPALTACGLDSVTAFSCVLSSLFTPWPWVPLLLSVFQAASLSLSSLVLGSVLWWAGFWFW